MVNSPTLEMIKDRKPKEERESHNDLEELGRPDYLNRLLVTTAHLMIENPSRQGDAAEVEGEMAPLTKLGQIRKFKKKINSPGKSVYGWKRTSPEQRQVSACQQFSQTPNEDFLSQSHKNKTIPLRLQKRLSEVENERSGTVSSRQIELANCSHQYCQSR
jgi:hypothetical protein